MITVKDAGGEVTVYEGPAILNPSESCPGEPCCGDLGGQCVLRADGGEVKCLASFPVGISWIDCICTEVPCEHQKQMADPKPVPVDELKQQAKAKALAAAATNKGD